MIFSGITKNDDKTTRNKKSLLKTNSYNRF
ncbi:MAG: hypothetical protein RLZZ231_792 [Bacteroidota bacterium]|jgi:hypothetical protein